MIRLYLQLIFWILLAFLAFYYLYIVLSLNGSLKLFD
ncbi:hypothetical protein F946_00938 [Acinetobacter johnsonii ANC 3681]|uniref:Uncharacterized protein n=1 Tax=Acinetobacter johnsonii ANC 3681 TaxID=1217662 RepID=N9BJU1_ACIJO|nr:hypothetical protein F946_00938 [Acinetobacter johnsonii ANC 3681]